MKKNEVMQFLLNNNIEYELSNPIYMKFKQVKPVLVLRILFMCVDKLTVMGIA